MKSRRIVFWQETPSPHQAPWIRALAGLLPDCEVIGVFQRGLDSRRLAMGWCPPDWGQTLVIMAPDRSAADRLLRDESERTIHVFSSIIHNPSLNAAFKRALSSRATVGILSEGRDRRGLKGALRFAHSLIHEHSYRQRVDFVLAIGRVGTKWFSKCGYNPGKVFPFCYVVEKHQPEGDRAAGKGAARIASAGSLIPLKRVDLLLEALARVPCRGWNLMIIGDGELGGILESRSARLGLREKVTFKGSMPNLQLRRELDRADIFVFTSRADGWGAVVNEALMSGVPVICSDYPGAADLIVPGFNGDLFRCDSAASLAEVLEGWIAKGPLEDSMREQIRGWSQCMEGEPVARYFLDIIGYLEDRNMERPQAPWIQWRNNRAAQSEL